MISIPQNLGNGLCMCVQSIPDLIGVTQWNIEM